MTDVENTSPQGLLTRRSLLVSGGAAAAALALPVVGEVVFGGGSRRTPAHLRRSSYRALVGQPFRIKGSGSGLRLVAVEDLQQGPAGSENAFALIFRAPRDAPPLTDAVPTLSHPKLGTFPLLVAAGRSSAAGRSYAAVINRTHA